MNLFDFSERFRNEKDCVDYFKAVRLDIGVTCKKCSKSEHYWKKDKLSFQCKACGYRTSLRSGTTLENSHLPFLYWFKAIHLLTATKKTFSANEIQRQLKHNRYEPIWNMLHLIRSAMGKRDNKYNLTEFIEVDEGFFETIKDTDKSEAQKRGRGSQKQAKVLVLIESKPIKDKSTKYKHKPDRQAGYLKMIVMPDLQAESINKEIAKNVDKETAVLSDAYKGYNRLEEIISEHEIINTSQIKESHTVLPWVHSAIGNAKKILQGTHHSNHEDYLQNYLNEFCYKYNRRYFGGKLFKRLLIACIEVK
ncbi:MAG TPA: IS1595 family transposase [Chromatiaceae bacterium]|nr:IS1595 family transposase [Chromatiaceae bacterium]